MNWRTVNAIAQKDILEVRQNKSAWMPMVVVPLVFIIILPLAMILIPPAADAQLSSMTSDPDLQTFLANMPPSMLSAMSGLDMFPQIIVMMLGYLFAPMFLIMPLMFSTVIASESFAGERERKTLEALLYTSATDAELLLGKVLAALIPAVGISWGSFVIYTVILNTAAWPYFGRIWFPLPTWWPLIFWITPALAVLGIAVTVLISSRVQTFMGAYQSSAALVLLVVVLLGAQATGVLYLTVSTGLLIGLVFWAAALLLIRFVVQGFNRKALLFQSR